MKKILITGANGQVGWELCRQAKAKGFAVEGLTRESLDLTNLAELRHVIQRAAPDILINAAAYTAVDKAEQEQELAYLVNQEAPAVMAHVCAELNIPLLHISTDYVFAGDATQAYSETDPTSPLGVYGNSKYAGEQSIVSQHAQHIILRTSWVFGQHGQNFVKTMLRLAQEREELRVVGDQIGCPTAAKDIAQALLIMAERYFAEQNLPWGIYHYGGDKAVSWCQFAEAIISKARQQLTLAVKKITPIPTADYPTPAKRPHYSVLASEKIMTTFGIAPSDWQASLTDMIKELYK